MVLDVAALLQDRSPNQSGYWGLDLERFVDDWEVMGEAVRGMVTFLQSQHVFDGMRLPTDAVLAVLAALWPELPDDPDKRGNVTVLLRKYMWRSFLTDRYEQAAATAAFNDFRAIRRVIRGEAAEKEIPLFNEDRYGLPESAQLVEVGWPKNRGILGRGILALSLKAGARDIADDAQVTRANIAEREYHHLFPVALFSNNDLDDSKTYRALNCALITWRTNRRLAAKEPEKYLRERADAATLGEDDLHRRLDTHLIPYEALKVGGYDKLPVSERKKVVETDFQAFLVQRAEVVRAAVEIACSGRDLQAHDVFAKF